MSHQFESGFTVREPAWHSLGKVIGHDVTDPAEALVMADVDWEVYKVQLLDPETGEKTAKHAIKRKTDNRILGYCSAQYKLLQNRNAFEWFRPFLESGQAYIDSAGSLYKGEVIYISSFLRDGKNDRQIAEVVPGDPVENRLLMTNNHNPERGGIPIAFVQTRVVCANTLGAAKAEYMESGKYIVLRHDSSLDEKLKQLQTSINLSQRQFEEQIDFYRALAQRQLTLPQFRDLLENLYSPQLAALDNEDKPDLLAEYRLTQMILKNFESSRDLQMAGVRGTAWAGFNALTEYYTHDVRSTDDSTRTYSTVFGSNKAVIDKARRQFENLLN